MKQLTRRIIGVVAAFALTGTVLASIFWVVATTNGTRWLLESAVRMVGVNFTAKKIEGKIIDHLHLTEVRIGLAQQTVAIDSLDLRWKPLLLLTGTVAVQELVIKEILIQDDTPPDGKPPVLAWPKVSGNAQLFDGRIARLRVTNLSYRRLQEQPLLVTSIAGSLVWQDSTLTINTLAAESTTGRIQGNISTGFTRPSLTADLAITLAQPLAEMDHFFMQVRNSAGPEQFVGRVTLSGNAGTRKLLELSGNLGMAKDAINLRLLRLTRPDHKGLLTADGSLAFTAKESLLSLKVTAAGLDLAPELGIPTDLSGTLKFAGTPDRYRGEISLANQALGWQAVSVTAAYQGTRAGLNLAPLNGAIIDGSLTGNLDMDWRDGFSMRGAISGRNLNPARFDPGWKGIANFNAVGTLAKSGTAPLRGSVSATLLESRLHGQALTGELQADFAGSNLSLTNLALQGKGFNLHASGDLKQHLALSAQISDFSRLVPGSGGTLQANGWIRWHDRQLSGAATGAGSRLAYAGTRIAAANLTARLDEGTGYPLHVTASLRDVVYDGYALSAVTLAADGTLQQHVVNATLRSTDAEARLSLTAGYKAGDWKGTITRLAGSGKSGPWNLTNPAAFEVSTGTLSLSPLILTAGTAERLEIAADLTRNPLAGQVRAQWAGLDLARFKPLLPPDTVLTGRISGQATGLLLPGQHIELDGNAALSGGTLHQDRPDGELKLTFTSATASWGWRGDALAGTLALNLAEHGQLRGKFQLPLAARFPVAVNPKGPLRATLSGQVQEKGLITTLFPGLVQESSGELDAELDINGTWEAPLIGGKMRLSRAGAYLPTAGIHLKDVQLAAHLDKDHILIDSFKAVSGPGHIEGTALITLAGWKVISYRGTIGGENFQTVFFPELQMLSTPKLTFEGTPQKLKLRGDLRIPDLNIIGTQSRAAVAPSSDVIREGRTGPVAKASPLAMDVQIRVLLGDKVFIKASGINAQLGGAIDLSSSSLDRITSTGEIKVVKGHYRTYGVNLEIVRGRLFFAGGTIDRPTLDFLALRTIGNIRAGVTVAGTLQRPITKLYSEPAMPDVDILAYIVLGHPLGSSGEQVSLLTQAARALLTSSQASLIQEKIKNRLGLSTLEIQRDVGGSTSPMGYKPLQVTAPGAIPADQQTGITETVLTVGKYLTPQLYISYGKSLFTGSNLFKLRYDIFKHWQVETQTGSGESGADLYYKMEFK